MAAMAIGALALSAISSCILAEPPPELPKPPSRHPNILRAQVIPAVDRPLGALPTKAGFIVPVELPDPTKDFEWRVFVDFDPITNPVAVLGQVQPGSTTAPDVIMVPFSFVYDPKMGGIDTGVCHRIEFVAALGFDTDHGANAGGSDSVVWFYTPTGNLSGCTTSDADTDGAFPPVEAGPDVAATGDAGD